MESGEKCILYTMGIISLGIMGMNAFGIHQVASEWKTQRANNSYYFEECQKYPFIIKLAALGIMTFSASICLLLCTSLLFCYNFFFRIFQKCFFLFIYIGFGPALMGITGYSLYFHQLFYTECTNKLGEEIKRELLLSPLLMSSAILIFACLITIIFAIREILECIAYFTHGGGVLGRFADWVTRVRGRGRERLPNPREEDPEGERLIRGDHLLNDNGGDEL